MKDKTTVAGLVIVGLAAAALTFTTLFALAVACGFDPWLAWLLPLTVDAAGLVALRVWLRDGPRFAKTLTLACIGLSIAGNATQHGLAAYHLPVPWWVIVVVAAVPPAMLASVVHVAHRVTDRTDTDRTTADRPADEPVDGRTDPPAIEAGPAAQTSGPDTPEPAAVTPDQAARVPVLQVVDQRYRPEPADGPGVTDQLLPEVVQWSEALTEPPSARAVRTRFGVGHERAKRLLEQLEVAQ